VVFAWFGAWRDGFGGEGTFIGRCFFGDDVAVVAGVVCVVVGVGGRRDRSVVVLVCCPREWAAIATVSYTAPPREPSLPTTVFAWSSGKHGLFVLFDVPAGCYPG
jgi:hypothetical protein